MSLYLAHVGQANLNYWGRMELRTLEGDSKAIGAEDSEVSFDDGDDDATTLQKAAAVIFGFSGAILLAASMMLSPGCLFPAALQKSACGFAERPHAHAQFFAQAVAAEV